MSLERVTEEEMNEFLHSGWPTDVQHSTIGFRRLVLRLLWEIVTWLRGEVRE